MKNLLWLAVLAAGLLALTGPAGAEDKKAAADDLKAIQGTWKVESAESSGGDVPPPEVLKKIRFAFEGDMLTLDMGDMKHHGKIKLSPGKKPKQIDITPDDGPEKGKTFPGIYEVTGDTLKLCFSEKEGTRPTEFAAKGERVNYIVLKREKK